MSFKKRYLQNVIIPIIAVLFGFMLSNFANNGSHIEETLKEHKLLQRCRQNERALTFLEKGGEYFPDYENPRTLNDKINYIFQNYFKKSPLTKYFVNKYFAKKYISDIVGEEHVAKLLGVWTNPEDIEWSKLPNRFVLKATHGRCGQQVILIEDKSKINIPEIMKKFRIFCQDHEMKEMGITKERIIAEEYLEPSNGFNSLVDYKFFCSYGKPIVTFCYAYDNSGKYYHENKLATCYSIPEWKQLPISVNNRKQVFFPRPKNFEKMIELAKKLSKHFPLIRVDLYEIGDRVIVGELTEDACGAKYVFSPVIWDFKFGEMIDVPSLSEIEKMIERDKKICELQKF